MPTGKLDRWVLAKLASAALVVMIVLMGLYIVGDLSQHVDDIAEVVGELGWKRVAGLLASYYSMGVTRYLFEFPDLILAGATAAVMVGVLRSGEAAAVQGMGRSLRRFMLPIVLFSTAFGLLRLAASEFIVPRAIMREEAFRADLLGGRAMSGVVFPAEGADAVVGVGYAGEDGRVWDMAVMERTAEGFHVVQVEEAYWDSKGRLDMRSAPRLIMHTGGSADLPAGEAGRSRLGELSIAPAAALRLRLLGPSSVRFNELMLLGGGRMYSELGSRVGSAFLLVGAVMMVIGLLAGSAGGASAGRGVAVFLAVELLVRLLEAVTGGAGAASSGIAAAVFGLSAGVVALAAGLWLYVRMPT